MPDFSGIAVAASGGWAWGAQVAGEKESLDSKLEEAIGAVLKEKRCAILDCVLDTI